MGFVDDVGSEGVDVVGAEQPEVLGTREGEVEQRLVALALNERLGAAAGPDRLADARRRRPWPAWASTNSRHAGMMRAGLVPTSAMSAKVTPSASAPSSSRRRAILAALMTTRIGSPPATASRIHGSVASRNPSSPA